MKPILVIANIDAWRDTRVVDLLAGEPLDLRSAEAGDPIPTDARPFSAVIVGGGLIAVAEAGRHAFMRDELRLIESALEANVPYLGMCLGGQLLAHVLGAPIRGGAPEVGYCAIEPTDPELEELSHVFQWHWEGFGLPSGATRLARSPAFDTQAFRYARALALQFHPDVRAKDVPDWLARFPSERGAVDLAEQMALADRHDPTIERWFARLLDDLRG